jgi:hypothetical protein
MAMNMEMPFGVSKSCWLAGEVIYARIPWGLQKSMQSIGDPRRLSAPARPLEGGTTGMK